MAPYVDSGTRRVSMINSRNADRALPSFAIMRNKLKPVDVVLRLYRKLCVESKVSTLFVKLAREAVIGATVMSRCTPLAGGKKPGLPLRELNELKQIIFNVLPNYWGNQGRFDGVWAESLDSIGQACKHLHHSFKSFR